MTGALNPYAKFPSDRDEPAYAVVGSARLSNADIRALELDRARHALSYLKRRLGNEMMMHLLADDLAATTAQVREWLHASAGRWQTREVELVVHAPSAHAFYAWYRNAVVNAREADMRAGHPEHFVSHPRSDGWEVVENIGETELPWRVLYQSIDENGGFPTPYDRDYPVRFGSEILDQDGLLIGYTQHALRDSADGLQFKLTTSLPAAVPAEVVTRHLHHYVIEFRNWARAATRWVLDGGGGLDGTGLPVRTDDTTDRQGQP